MVCNVKKNLSSYKEILLKLAAVYDHGDKINDLMLTLQAEHLSQWPIEEVAAGATAYMADSKNSFFPRPVHSIMEYVHPTVDKRAIAVAISAKIWACIGKYGYPGADRAKADIGEAGWEVVKQRGGWVSVCEESNTASPGIFQAQLRDLAESVITRSRAGKLNDEIKLPGPANERLKGLMDQATKRIEGGKQ